MPLRLNRNHHKLNLSVNKFHSNFLFFAMFLRAEMGEMRSVQQSEKLCFIESKVFNVSASEGLLSCCVSNASEGSPGKLGDKTLRERCLWGYNGGNIKLRKLFTFKRKSNNYFPSSFFLAHKNQLSP